MIPVGLFVFLLFAFFIISMYQQYHLIKRANIIDKIDKNRHLEYEQAFMLAMLYAKYLTKATIRAREYDKLIDTLAERGRIKSGKVPGYLISKEETLEWAYSEKIFSKDWANVSIQVPIFKTMLKDHAQLRAHYLEFYGKEDSQKTTDAKKT